MDELMLMEYLRNKGIGRNMGEHEFVEKFREFMSNSGNSRYRRHGNNDDYFSMDWDNSYRRHGYPDDFTRMFNSNKYNELWRRNTMRDSEMDFDMDSEYESHFTDSQAKHLVSKMFHFENGRKHVGERFDMNKAREISERFNIPSATPADVYIAINAQYHDYNALFKAWFGDSVDQKIIESAIVFWFKDDDYKHGSKVMKYFREN